MDITKTDLYLFCVLLGSIVHAISGFGFGVFVMSVFPYFMPNYTMGLVLSGLIGITITAYLSIRQFRAVRARYVVVPFVASVVAGFLATRWLKGISDIIMGRALGIFLILLSIYFLAFEKRIKIRTNVRNGIIAGTAAGIIDTMFGMGGTPLALYLSSIAESKEQYVANLSCVILLLSAGTAVNRIIAGMITLEILKYYALGLVFVVLGMMIGGKIFSKFSPGTLRKVVYIFIMVSGLLLLARSLA